MLLLVLFVWLVVTRLVCVDCWMVILCGAVVPHFWEKLAFQGVGVVPGGRARFG